MSSVAPIDPVVARHRAEGQDGPSSQPAREKQEASHRAAVAFGGAVSQLDGARHDKRVNPLATAEKLAQQRAVQARTADTEERRSADEDTQASNARRERLSDEKAAYEAARESRAGQYLDFYV